MNCVTGRWPPPPSTSSVNLPGAGGGGHLPWFVIWFWCKHRVYGRDYTSDPRQLDAKGKKPEQDNAILTLHCMKGHEEMEDVQTLHRSTISVWAGASMYRFPKPSHFMLEKGHKFSPQLCDRLCKGLANNHTGKTSDVSLDLVYGLYFISYLDCSLWIKKIWQINFTWRFWIELWGTDEVDMHVSCLHKAETLVRAFHDVGLCLFRYLHRSLFGLLSW